MFKLNRSAETGDLEWVVTEDEECSSLGEEIALSTYGDMLHDGERNNKYHQAIHNAVSRLKTSGQKASKHVQRSASVRQGFKIYF